MKLLLRISLLASLLLLAGCLDNPSGQDTPAADAGCPQGDCGADAQADVPCEGVDCLDGECVPEEVCEVYCYERLGRCIEQNCDSSYGLYDLEMRGCLDGAHTGLYRLPGCIELANDSDQNCQQLRDHARTYAAQACDSTEQKIRRCKTLLSYRDEAGADAMEGCGCQPAQTAQSCDIGDDAACDAYEVGFCAGPDDATTGLCTAECMTTPRDWVGGRFRDATCGENGWCRKVEDGFGICERHCTSLQECTDASYCVPAINPVDNEGQVVSDAWLGICDNGSIYDIGDQFDFCTTDADCQDGRCRQGTCQPPCTEDNDCDYGDCVDETGGQFCEINWAE